MRSTFEHLAAVAFILTLAIGLTSILVGVVVLINMLAAWLFDKRPAELLSFLGVGGVVTVTLFVIGLSGSTACRVIENTRGRK